MASIKKRDNGTYLITVSCGYDMNNKQIRRTMTYKPDGKMTSKQIEKGLVLRLDHGRFYDEGNVCCNLANQQLCF